MLEEIAHAFSGLNRVYCFPVEKYADFATILFCHPTLAYLDTAVISGRVQAGMHVQLQVTIAVLSPCQACDIIAALRHVLTHTQALWS